MAHQEADDESGKSDKNVFRKLVSKFKAATTKKADIKDLNDPVLENECLACDTYLAVVEVVNSAILEVLNGNPLYRQPLYSEQRCVYPEGKSPYEMLRTTMHDMHTQLWEHNLIELNMKMAKKMAQIERHYQEQGRDAIHKMRYYIRTFYIDFDLRRTEVLEAKTILDAAIDDSKAKNGTPTETRAVKKSRAKFEKKLERLKSFLSTDLPKHQSDHHKDMISFLNVSLEFHKEMAAAHKQLIGYRPMFIK